MNCVKCNKPCREHKLEKRRDGSRLIKSIHDDKTDPCYFWEWPTINDFMYRKYPNDASRRVL